MVLVKQKFPKIKLQNMRLDILNTRIKITFNDLSQPLHFPISLGPEQPFVTLQILVGQTNPIKWWRMHKFSYTFSFAFVLADFLRHFN